MQNDPFLSFLSDLSKKIAIEKDHKKIMEKVDSNESAPQELTPLEGFISTLKEKITNVKKEEPIKVESIEDIINRDLESVVIETNVEEEQPFTSFVNKLKDIFESPVSTKTQAVSTTNVKSEDNNTVEAKKENLEEIESKSYVDELEKIKNSIAIEKEDTKVTEIKKLIEEYAEKYIKKAVGMIGESGGGTNAVQYANGGTMNGDLNVNGNYLSGGVNLLDIFASSPDKDNQTLAYNDNNYNLSISNGNVVNLSSINTTFYDNSGKYESTFLTVSALSAKWNSGLQTLSFNENDYNLSISNGNTVSLSALNNSLAEIITLSGNWNSNYTTVSQNSAYWADTRNNITFEKDVTINGNLTALGTSTFKNTLFTTTTALSVYNTGPGPALYIFQAAGPYDVASFYDGDGVEVLHIGNAQGGGNPKGKVGINESFPNVELTVNGQISANNVIYASGGNSDQWNSNYTTTSTNSASWTQSFTNLTANSALYILPPLPVPKIWLDNYLPSNVPYLSGSNNTSSLNNTLGLAGTFRVTKPVCIVNDIAQELLDNFNIFIEMVIFKCKKKYNPIHGMGYSIPIGTASKIWGNFWSRSGKNQNYRTPLVGPHIGGPFTPPNPLRYNHLPVYNNGDKINLSLCLYGRFKEYETFYQLNNSYSIYDNSIITIAPFGGKAAAGKNGSYTRNYKPMYVAFRYIVWMPNHNYGKGQIISGPLSPTIRISNTHWPFLKDHFASNLYNKPCVTINPQFNKLSFKCEFV